jgi:hypothetical protein
VSRSRQKGTGWETAVVRYLQDNGFPAERAAMHGAVDRGDIWCPSAGTVECKNEGIYRLSEWADELEIEVANGKTDYGFVVAHRKGKSSPADAYVLTTGRLWLPLLRALA